MTEAVNGLAWCLSTSAFPVSMDDFARIAPLREVWFRPTGTRPSLLRGASTNRRQR